MKVTIKQIARQAGLSHQTVSYVLNDKAHLFRPETRKRVLEAADALGYRPNASARTMRTGRFKSLALLTSTEWSRSFMSPLAGRGLHVRLHERGHNLLHAEFSDKQLNAMASMPRLLREMCVDGLLVNYNEQIPDSLFKLVESCGLPAVWINAKLEHDCAYPDDLGGAREATQRLIRAGHRRIGYIDLTHTAGDRQLHYSATDRLEGYTRAMDDAGLKPVICNSAEPVSTPERPTVVQAFLARPERPTALLTYGDPDALSVLLAAERLGLRMEDDLKVMTFDWRKPQSRLFACDTMLTPEAETASEAVDMLLERIERPGNRLPSRRLPLQFVPGIA